MKSLLKYVFLFGFISLFNSPVWGQSVVGQRVERYLISSYSMTKAEMKENGRLLKMMEDRLEDYLQELDKQQLNKFQEGEEGLHQFTSHFASVNDELLMRQMMEESKRSFQPLIASVLEKGVKSMKEAQYCRKVIDLLKMEKDLLKLRNEKLVLLMKDDYSRSQFVDTVLVSGSLSDNTDTKKLMITVDLSLSDFDLEFGS